MSARYLMTFAGLLIAMQSAVAQPTSNVRCVLDETQYFRQLLATKNLQRTPGDEALVRVEMEAIAKAIEQKCAPRSEAR